MCLSPGRQIPVEDHLLLNCLRIRYIPVSGQKISLNTFRCQDSRLRHVTLEDWLLQNQHLHFTEIITSHEQLIRRTKALIMQNLRWPQFAKIHQSHLLWFSVLGWCVRKVLQHNTGQDIQNSKRYLEHYGKMPYPRPTLTGNSNLKKPSTLRTISLYESKHTAMIFLTVQSPK